MPNKKVIDGISLMVLAMGILIIPGIFVNNMIASGLINQPQGIGNCPQPPVGETVSFSSGNCFFCPASSTAGLNPVCTIAQNVGCQAQPGIGGNSLGNCNLQGASISFVNACSPFTQLYNSVFQGNYLGLVESMFQKCSAVNGVAIFSAGNQLTAVSFNHAVLPQGSQNVTIAGCTSTGGVIGFYGSQTYSCTTATPGIQGSTLPYIAGFSLGPLFWNGVIGNATAHSVPSYATVNFLDSATPQNAFIANCLFYGDYNGVPGGIGNAVKLMTCNTFTGFVALQSSSSGSFSIPTNFSQLISVVLSVLGLAVVVIIGLGFYGGITGLTFGANFASNPQGTKQAFVFGISMLIFFPLFSEFGTWFQSGFFPAGLDGVLGIISIGIIAIFFFGAFSVSQTGTATST